MEVRVPIEGTEGNGIVVGENQFTHAVVRQLSAAELIAAAQAGEVLKILPKIGATLVHSPVVTLQERVCRAVARLEAEGGAEHPGPLNKTFLQHFSAADYDRLIQALDQIDEAAAGATKRGVDLGRNDGAGGDA